MTQFIVTQITLKRKYLDGKFPYKQAPLQNDLFLTDQLQMEKGFKSVVKKSSLVTSGTFWQINVH